MSTNLLKFCYIIRNPHVTKGVILNSNSQKLVLIVSKLTVFLFSIALIYSLKRTNLMT